MALSYLILADLGEKFGEIFCWRFFDLFCEKFAIFEAKHISGGTGLRDIPFHFFCVDPPTCSDGDWVDQLDESDVVTDDVWSVVLMTEDPGGHWVLDGVWVWVAPVGGAHDDVVDAIGVGGAVTGGHDPFLVWKKRKESYI